MFYFQTGNIVLRELDDILDIFGV